MEQAGFVSQPVRRSISIQKWMVVAAYVLGVLVLRFLNRGLGGVLDWRLSLFVVGVGLGMLVELADRLVYVYYSRPDEELSMQVKNLVAQRRLGQVVSVLEANKASQLKLSTNNVLFMVVWVGLALFLLTRLMTSTIHTIARTAMVTMAAIFSFCCPSSFLGFPGLGVGLVLVVDIE